MLLWDIFVNVVSWVCAIVCLIVFIWATGHTPYPQRDEVDNSDDLGRDRF